MTMLTAFPSAPIHKVFTQCRRCSYYLANLLLLPLPKGQSAKQRRAKKRPQRRRRRRTTTNKHKIYQLARLRDQVDLKRKPVALLARWLPDVRYWLCPPSSLLFSSLLRCSCCPAHVSNFAFQFNSWHFEKATGNGQKTYDNNRGSPLGSSWVPAPSPCWNQSQHNMANYGASSLTFALALHTAWMPASVVCLV